MAIIEGARHRLGGSAAEATAGGAFGAQEVIKATYDFAVDGGAVSSINLLDAANVPAGFIALFAVVEVVTVPTSGGAATLGISLEGAGDIVAAAVISGAPWSTVGRKAGIPVGAATSVKTTAVRNVVAVVGAAALTAGVINVYLIGVRTA